MNWKNIFERVGIRFTRRFPVEVSLPAAEYRFYKDKGDVLLGYSLDVTYSDNKVEHLLFATDEDKLCLVDRRKAFKNACSCYKKVVEKIHKHQR